MVPHWPTSSTRVRGWLWLSWLLISALALTPARAQTLPPIVDRNFSLDAYDGVAIGSVRIIGMGGAAIATAEGSSGTLLNVAAPAVRSATARGSWDWDFHLDAVTTTAASDPQNSGFVDAGNSTTVTGGIAGVVHNWGAALVGTTVFSSSRGVGSEQLDTALGRVKFAVARAFANEAYTIGAALRGGLFDVETASGRPLFRLRGIGIEAGALWRPFRQDVRIGASAALPVSGADVTSSGCDPLDCEGHILPRRIVVPWQFGVGAAYRIGPTRWDQRVNEAFRDERSFVIAADVIVTGATANGAGLEAFARGLLQRSGRSIAMSPRLGGELELFPGRLRLRAGTYWEPPRLVDISGRIHATAGAELRWLQFELFGPRRLRIAVTVDGARRYLNAGLSLGFWQ